MDKEQLNELLDRIYELEGLIHLALSRDDNPQHLSSLIRHKAIEVCEDFISEQPSPSQTIDDHHYTDSHQHDEYHHEVVDSYDRTLPIDNSALEEISYDEEMTEPVHEDYEGEKMEILDSIEPEREPESEPVIGQQLIQSPRIGEQTRGKLVFSLNDRFRFRRELFSNSAEEFDRAMATIASMDSFDEAESYFIDELGWDGDNEDVKAFLNILQSYFK